MESGMTELKNKNEDLRSDIIVAQEALKVERNETRLATEALKVAKSKITPKPRSDSVESQTINLAANRINEES